MAITWGNPVGQSGKYVRVGIDMTVPTPGVNDATVPVTTKYYVQGMVSCYDDNNIAQITGNAGTFTGSISWHIYNNYGYWNDNNIVLLKTITTNVATSYSGVKVESNFNFQNIDYAGGTLNVYVAKQMAARPYTAPPAPTSATKTRNSDTQFKIAWVAGSAGAGNPIQGYKIIRYSSDNGNGEIIASVAASAVDYLDNSTKADTAYNYSVYAYNSGGNSAATSTGADTFTTPKDPSNVQVSKNVSDIVVTWADNSRIESGYDIYDYADGSATPVKVGSAAANATSWTYAAPDAAKTHLLAVQAVQSTTSLKSNLVKAASTVQLLAPPNPPTNLKPNGTWFDATVLQAFSMTHNPVDSTGITAIELQYRIPAETQTWTLTGKLASDDNIVNPATSRFANDKSYEWQARTWGQHASPSNWSATAVFYTAQRPTGSITTPSVGTEWNSDTVTMTWDYASQKGTPQASFVAELLADDGTVLERQNVASKEQRVTFSAKVANSTYYRVKLTVVDANGIASATSEVRFHITYVSPPGADADMVWDPELGAVTLSINNPTDASMATPSHVEVYRLNPDGNTEYLGIFDLNATVKDPVPWPGGDATYLLRTISTIGSASSSWVSIPAPNTGDWFWINAGPNMETVGRFRLGAPEPKVSSKYGRETVLRTFAGRKKPMVFSGTARSRKIDVDVILENTDLSGNPDALERVLDEGGIMTLRMPSGRRYFVNLSEISFDEGWDVTGASMTFTETEDWYPWLRS